jgi:hypothetical protein
MWTPEKETRIDMERGQLRLVPLEYCDLGAKELRRVVLWRDK